MGTRYNLPCIQVSHKYLECSQSNMCLRSRGGKDEHGHTDTRSGCGVRLCLVEGTKWDGKMGWPRDEHCLVGRRCGARMSPTWIFAWDGVTPSPRISWTEFVPGGTSGSRGAPDADGVMERSCAGCDAEEKRREERTDAAVGESQRAPPRRAHSYTATAWGSSCTATAWGSSGRRVLGRDLARCRRAGEHVAEISHRMK